MGLPVSVVAAEIVMQHVVESALATWQQIPLWLRHKVHKDKIDDFHNNPNEQNVDIQCTTGVEENGKLPLRFLDCLVGGDNNELRMTEYRTQTHTDRLLDKSSYNLTSHKAMSIKTSATRL